jgi:hypothetical protein
VAIRGRREEGEVEGEDKNGSIPMSTPSTLLLLPGLEPRRHFVKWQLEGGGRMESEEGGGREGRKREEGERKRQQEGGGEGGRRDTLTRFQIAGVVESGVEAFVTHEHKQHFIRSLGCRGREEGEGGGERRREEEEERGGREGGREERRRREGDTHSFSDRGGRRIRSRGLRHPRTQTTLHPVPRVLPLPLPHRPLLPQHLPPWPFLLLLRDQASPSLLPRGGLLSLLPLGLPLNLPRRSGTEGTPEEELGGRGGRTEGPRGVSRGSKFG